MNLNLLIACVGAAVMFVMVSFGFRFLYDYRLENHAVEIVLFRLWPVYKVPVEDIEVIQKASWMKAGIGGTTLRLGNRLTSQCVLIERRSGRFRRIVITPNNGVDFVSKVLAAKAVLNTPS